MISDISFKDRIDLQCVKSVKMFYKHKPLKLI